MNRIPLPSAVASRLLSALFLASALTFCITHASAQVQPVDPPAFLTTDNSANWEPGQLLYRYVGIGRTAQVGYMNGNLYAGGFGGGTFRSWKWSDGTDAGSLFLDIDESDPAQEGLIDTLNEQGTHGYPNFGGFAMGGIQYVSPGVNDADGLYNTWKNPLPEFGWPWTTRPKPANADGINDGQNHVYYPWAMSFQWEMYDPTSGYVWIYRGEDLIYEWDALEETGIKGTTMLIGNLFFLISDRTNSGVAVYDISPVFETPAGPPVLLDKLSGAIGGYLNAVWENYLVLPTKVDGTTALQLIDFSDPTNLRFAGTIYSQLPLESGNEYVHFQDEYGFFHGNKVNMNTRQSALLLHGKNPELRPAGGEAGLLNTSQYSLPIGNLVVTGGYSTSGQDGIGLWVHQDEPDTNAPYVGYHVPRPNQTEFPVGAPITVMIHETLAAQTILYDDAVKLTRESDGALIDCYLSYSHDDLLMITPVNYLDVNTEYIVEIVDGVMKDVAGNGIQGYTFHFSTGSSVPSGNAPPAVTDITVSPVPVTPGNPVTIDVLANDPEGTATLEYRFSAGDGSDATLWQASGSFTHTYSTQGHYEAKLEVREVGNSANRIVDFATITAAVAPSGPFPQKSDPIALDPGSETVWAVNPDNDSVTLFDADTQMHISEFDLRSILNVTESVDPRSVAIDANGYAWIACHDADILAVVNSGGSLIGAIDMGYGSAPAGICASPDGTSIFITTQGGGPTDRLNGELVRYNASTMQETGSMELGPMARAIAVSGDGSRVFVSRFISGPSFGEIWEIDASNASSLSLTRTFQLWPHNAASASSDGPGMPNYIAGLTISPDGEALWYAAKKDNDLEGRYRGTDLGTDRTVRAMIGRIDLTSNSETLGDRIDFDNSDSPTSIAFSPFGDWAFATAQGNNLVGVFDVLAIREENDSSAKTTRLRLPTGLAPQGVLVDGVTNRLWTKNLTGRSISVSDLTEFFEAGNRSIANVDLSSVSPASERLTPSVLNGKKIFYNASDDGGLNEANRMSAEGYISCATCHVDGMHDGRTFDFTQRGEGLRNTTDLRGRAGLGHGNVHWTANFDEIHDFNLDIVNEFGGTGFPDGVLPNDPLGTSNDTGDQEMADLVAYVTSLGAETLPKSPFREAATGTMTPAAMDGAMLFNGTVVPSSGTALTCATCHDPAMNYTDSVVGDGTSSLHDVGTMLTSTGSRLGAPGLPPGIDTPTLLGIWNAAPYLHNGAATTLDDVFELGGSTDYQAEDGSPSGTNAAISLVTDDWPIPMGANGGAAIKMQKNDDQIAISGVDGGNGGDARLAIRYSANGSIPVSVTVNGGDAIPLSLPRTRGNTSTTAGWGTIMLDVDLLSGTSNTVTIQKTGGQQYSYPLQIDEITVATDSDLAAAQAHRQLLDVQNANPTEYEQVLAYLMQLDGQNAAGGPGGTGVIVEIDPWGQGSNQYDGFVFRVENTGNEPITQIDLAVTGGGHFDTFAPGSQFTVDPLFGSNNQAPESVTATLNFSPPLGAGQTDTVGAVNDYDAGDIDGTFTGLDVTVHFADGSSASGGMNNVGDSDDNDPDLWQFVSGGGGGATVIATGDTGISVDEGSNVIIDVLANDTPGGLSVQSVTQGSLGSVTNNGGNVTYTAAAGIWSGTDTFTYTATDGSNNDTATVEVTINATDGTTLVPAADLPLGLQLGVGYAANRVLDSNGHWQLVSDGTGFDTSGTTDSTYMLADDTVSGDFQAYVQLVSLSGPSGSRMGLMLRDGDTTGAEFIAIGSDVSNGYKFQERDGTGGASAESDAAAGSAHSFPGKWALLERAGNTVTVAVNEDNTGPYTPETTVDISGWSDTLHVGLFVHSGTNGTTAVGEFDGYTVQTIGGTGQFTYGNGGTPGTGNPWLISSGGSTQVNAAHYDQGGQGVAYNDDANRNGDSTYRPSSTVDGGSSVVGWIGNNEWLEYSIDVQVAGTYDIVLRAASNNSNPGDVKFVIGGTPLADDGAVLGTIDVPYTGGWGAYQTVTLSGVTLSAGPQIFRMEMVGGSFNLDWFELVALAPAMSNVLIDSGFEDQTQTSLGYAEYVDSADAGLGWLWTAGTSRAYTSQASGGNPGRYLEKTGSNPGGLIQVIADGGASTGAGTLGFDYRLGTGGGNLVYAVWGYNGSIDGEISINPNINSESNAFSRIGSGINLANTAGLIGEITTTTTGWTTETVDVDFGSGYDYIVVFLTLDSSTSGDPNSVDNVELTN